MDAEKILMVARSLRICAECEEDKCRPGCTEPEMDYDVGTLAEIIEQQQSDLFSAHTRIEELEGQKECCETCNCYFKGSYFGRCTCCSICECVPKEYLNSHVLNCRKSFWQSKFNSKKDYADLDAVNFSLKTAESRIAELEAEVDRLKSHDKEAMELLQTAIADLDEAHDCEYCDNIGICNLNQRDCESWRWQHADRYEAIKAQSTDNGNESKL